MSLRLRERRNGEQEQSTYTARVHIRIHALHVQYTTVQFCALCTNGSMQD